MGLVEPIGDSEEFIFEVRCGHTFQHDQEHVVWNGYALRDAERQWAFDGGGAPAGRARQGRDLTFLRTGER
jgi:hypothetical protein